MEGKPMKQFRNLVFGAVVAGICLAPAAWADGSLLVNGEVPDRAAFTAMTISPLAEALAAAGTAFPHLTHCALRALGAA
jgi:hypothetical protein